MRQEDLADYIGSNFYQYGRSTPGYPIAPPTSINYDASWEHRFKGSDLSFKLTPFLRQTQDQVQQFYLNVIQGFVSGLNVGSQRSEGLEFQLQKGDFSRNGYLRSALICVHIFVHTLRARFRWNGRHDGAWRHQSVDCAVQRIYEVLRNASQPRRASYVWRAIHSFVHTCSTTYVLLATGSLHAVAGMRCAVLGIGVILRDRRIDAASTVVPDVPAETARNGCTNTCTQTRADRRDRCVRSRLFEAETRDLHCAGCRRSNLRQNLGSRKNCCTWSCVCRRNGVSLNEKSDPLKRCSQDRS